MPRAHKLTINPKRIDWCCDQVGEEVEAVLKKAGIRASSSPDQVTYNQLQKIADYFERDDYFFMEKADPDEESVPTALFRNLAKPTRLDRKAQNLIRRVKRHRQIYIGLLEELEEERVPTLARYTDLDSAVKNARRLLSKHLPQSKKINFNDYRYAVERLGILVILSNRQKGKWHFGDFDENSPFIGFSLNYKKMPVIFVRNEINKKRQVFTLMHELGHVLLHKGDMVDGYRDIHGYSNAGKALKQEREANRFAARVLIPEAKVKQAEDSVKPVVEDVPAYDRALKALSNSIQVSVEAIILRLVDAGALENEKYVKYRAFLDKKRRAEFRASQEKQKNEEEAPQPPIVIKPGGIKKKKAGGGRNSKNETKTIFGENYVYAVLTAYNEKLITLSRASDYLDDLQVEEVQALNS